MSSNVLDLQPVLIGLRLTLRPLVPEDLSALFAAASDPLIWEMHPHPDRYKESVFREYFASGIASRGAFAVVGNAAGKIIGSSRYYGLDEEKKSVFIGYTFLARSYWGGGFNQEMKALMLDHAFCSVDVVRFEVGETNIRSRRALEKIGASVVERVELDGKPLVKYQIMKRRGKAEER